MSENPQNPQSNVGAVRRSHSFKAMKLKFWFRAFNQIVKLKIILKWNKKRKLS